MTMGRAARRTLRRFSQNGTARLEVLLFQIHLGHELGDRHVIELDGGEVRFEMVSFCVEVFGEFDCLEHEPLRALDERGVLRPSRPCPLRANSTSRSFHRPRVRLEEHVGEPWRL
jgi:hypothetical protein